MEYVDLTRNLFYDCEWVQLDDLKEFFSMTEDHIQEKDIDLYIEIFLRKLTYRFGKDIGEAIKIIREMNTAFFEAKKDIYRRVAWLDVNDDYDKEKLFTLLKKFFVPVKIEKINMKENSVSEVVKRFNALSDLEKLDFLSRIEKVSIKVDKI